MAKPRHDPGQHLTREVTELREAALGLSAIGADHWARLLCALADAGEAARNVSTEEALRWTPPMVEAVAVARIVLTTSPLVWERQ